MSANISTDIVRHAVPLRLLSYLLHVVGGTDLSGCSTYYVAVHQIVLQDVINDVIYAMAVMFAAHFTFNLNYSPKCVALLEYMQRYCIVLFVSCAHIIF